MNSVDIKQMGCRPRLLVAIASYGQKNIELLKQLIRGYQNMSLKVDVVVLSEAPKDLGPGVEVVVGLPCKNPWSLPFAHKPIFAQRIDRYDLFAYSEDDIGVTEENIQAFLRATSELRREEIAGFVRHEVDRSGAISLPDFQAMFHWKPESVRRRGAYITAEFTNEHAAFYLLTQDQLRRAIASGGFLREPYEGRHDMLCTAATDPYTSCGFRKVICISVLEDFLIHHMSNVYVGRFGIPLTAVKEQVEALTRILDGSHPASSLCETETNMPHSAWSKSYYEAPVEALLRMVPDAAKSVLSVGCGWGATEARLRDRGMSVTALPLDSVIGASAARLGVEVIYGTLEECLTALGRRHFDCVLVSNLAHLQAEPGRFLEQCAKFVGHGGALVVRGPNFNRISDLTKRILSIGDHGRLWHFQQSGISLCGPGTVARHLRPTGLRVTGVRWFNHALPGKQLAGIRASLGSLTARDWVLQATRR